MSKTTSTLNPLHFEDLEPHRFEDLARQLIYDFKQWKSLEATGRSGSDDGFDVRGWEYIANIDNESLEDETNKETQEHLWLIQCKREQRIAPQKLKGYLEKILKNQQDQIYGIIFK